jgi:hypothetical protein
VLAFDIGTSSLSHDGGFCLWWKKEEKDWRATVATGVLVLLLLEMNYAIMMEKREWIRFMAAGETATTSQIIFFYVASSHALFSVVVFADASIHV